MGDFKLHINPVLDALLPGLTEEEDIELDQSLERDGQWVSFPLTSAPDGTVCDGMNRYKKLLAKNITALYTIDKSLDTLEKQKIFVLRNVLSRRNLNTWQKGQATIKLLELVPIGINEAIKKSGSSKRTFFKVQAIHKNAPEHIKKKLDKGTLSVDTAYKIITQKERSLRKTDLAQGISDVILCDFPTGFERGATTRGSADNHYPTMTPQEIMQWIEDQEAYKKIADVAIGFFWFSTAIQYDTVDVFYTIDTGMSAIPLPIKMQVPFYKAVFDKLGFDKVLGEFVWEKDKFGLGTIVRNQHEKCLIATKGNMPMPAVNFSSIIHAERGEHSRKPEIYDMIEAMYPAPRNYTEWFSRHIGTRKGWVFHGNEIK